MTVKRRFPMTAGILVAGTIRRQVSMALASEGYFDTAASRREHADG